MVESCDVMNVDGVRTVVVVVHGGFCWIGGLNQDGHLLVDINYCGVTRELMVAMKMIIAM